MILLKKEKYPTQQSKPRLANVRDGYISSSLEQRVYRKNFSVGKRGEGAGDMVMVLWFFLLLALLAGGIALGLSVFFGADHDIRVMEATIFGARVQECIKTKGAFWEQGGFSVCGLSAAVLDDVAVTKLGLLVCERDCDSGKRIVQSGSNFEACDFVGKNKAYAQCSKNRAQYNDMDYEIVATSNHEARRQN